MKGLAQLRPKSLKFRFVVAALSLTGLLLLWLATQSAVLMQFYLITLYPRLSQALGAASGLFPFSVVEFLLLGLLSGAAAGLVWVLFQVLTRRQNPRNLAWSVISVGSAVVLPLLAWGYLAWGLLYAAPDLALRAKWENDGSRLAGTQGELLSLCGEAIEQTNANYLLAMGSEDAGRPSSPRAGPENPDWDRALQEGFAKAAPWLGLESSSAAAAPAKAIWLSEFLSYLGIAGFYSPWTAEANYNRLVPACSRAHAISHEKAHQFGLAREDEANFAGFLAATLSDDPYLRYSGFLFAQNQLLRELARKRPEELEALLARRLPGVQRDLRDLRRFWRRYEGRATRVSQRVNNSYLKMHGIEEGVQSYSRSVRFLVLFARSNSGSLKAEGL